tara:strand:+ start:1137 stop:1739 length:603 start_codon:yes stop_codon:yes gene_type:complete
MSTLTVGTISEKVTDAGVAVDGVTLKDGGATFTSSITGTSVSASGTLAVTGNTTVGGTLVNTGLITASAGVAIGGTGSANTLDDFEEGTFSAVASTNAGTFSHSSGVYVKIGRLVLITCFFTYTGASTSATRTYTGLPFAVSNTFAFTGVDYHGTSWSAHFGRVQFEGGTSSFLDNLGAITGGSFGASNSTRIQGFYLTD